MEHWLVTERTGGCPGPVQDARSSIAGSGCRTPPLGLVRPGVAQGGEGALGGDDWRQRESNDRWIRQGAARHTQPVRWDTLAVGSSVSGWTRRGCRGPQAAAAASRASSATHANPPQTPYTVAGLVPGAAAMLPQRSPSCLRNSPALQDCNDDL
jgi:hypothetical protein